MSHFRLAAASWRLFASRRNSSSVLVGTSVRGLPNARAAAADALKQIEKRGTRVIVRAELWERMLHPEMRKPELGLR